MPFEIGHINLCGAAVYEHTVLARRLLAPGHPLQQPAERRKVVHLAQLTFDFGTMPFVESKEQHAGWTKAACRKTRGAWLSARGDH